MEYDRREIRIVLRKIKIDYAQTRIITANLEKDYYQ